MVRRRVPETLGNNGLTDGITRDLWHDVPGPTAKPNYDTQSGLFGLGSTGPHGEDLAIMGSAGGAPTAALGPLSRLRSVTSPILSTAPAGFGPTNNSETTFFQLTSGAGEVLDVHINLGLGGPNTAARFRVYTDGNATPDVDVDFGSLFATAYPGTPGNVGGLAGSTQNMSIQTQNAAPGSPPSILANPMVGNIRFPIPFSNGIKLTLFVPATPALWSGPVFWTQVVYRTGVTEPFRLKSISTQGTAVPINGAATPPINLFDIMDGPGNVVWIGISAQGTGGPYGVAGQNPNYPTFIERPVLIAIDGGAASGWSDGFEDFFQSGWGGEGRQNPGFSEPCAIFGGGWSDADPNFNGGLDVFQMCDGVPFNSQFLCQLSQKPGYVTALASANYQYSVLYYKGTSQHGIGVIGPQGPPGPAGGATGPPGVQGNPGPMGQTGAAMFDFPGSFPAMNSDIMVIPAATQYTKVYCGLVTVGSTPPSFTLYHNGASVEAWTWPTGTTGPTNIHTLAATLTLAAGDYLQLAVAPGTGNVGLTATLG